MQPFMRVAAVLLLVLQGPAVAAALHGSPAALLSFGIVTDFHYSDVSPSGSRHYRDSLAKMADAAATFAVAGNTSFIIELGDLKDTDAELHCDKPPLNDPC